VDIDIFALSYTPLSALIYIFNILSINLQMPIPKVSILFVSKFHYFYPKQPAKLPADRDLELKWVKGKRCENYPKVFTQFNFYPARPVAPGDGTGVKIRRTDYFTGIEGPFDRGL
jgi:hypothetical protein